MPTMKEAEVGLTGALLLVLAPLAACLLTPVIGGPLSWVCTTIPAVVIWKVAATHLFRKSED